MRLAEKVANDLSSSSDPKKQQQGYTLYRQYQSTRDDMTTYSSNQEKFQNAVDQEIAKKDEYKILYNPKTGGTYTIDEMSKDFPTVILETPQGEQRTITPNEYAQMYRGGQINAPNKLQLMGQSYAHIGDKGYKIKDIMYGKEEMEMSANDRNTYHNERGALVQKLYGKSGEQDELQRKVGNTIIGKMGMTPDGLTGKQLHYDVSTKGKTNEVQRETGIELISHILIPGNHEQIYYIDKSTGKETPLSEEDKRALLDMTYADAITTNMGAVDYTQVGPNGVPVMKIKMQKSKDSEKDDQQSGVDITSLLKKGEIYIDYNVNTQDPVLSQLPQRTEVFKYDKLFKGQEVKSDQFDENTGFKYIIKPDPTTKGPDGRIGNVKIQYQSWAIDDKTGLPLYEKDGVTHIWAPAQNRSVNLMKGRDAKSPDELVGELYGFINSEFTKRINYRQAYLDNQQPKQGYMTVGEFYKKYK